MSIENPNEVKNVHKAHTQAQPTQAEVKKRRQDISKEIRGIITYAIAAICQQTEDNWATDISNISRVFDTRARNIISIVLGEKDERVRIPLIFHVQRQITKEQLIAVVEKVNRYFAENGFHAEAVLEESNAIRQSTISTGVEFAIIFQKKSA